MAIVKECNESETKSLCDEAASPREGMDLLERGCEVDFNAEDRNRTREELLDSVRNVDGLVTLLGDTIDAEIMDAGPKLKVIANYAVGSTT